MPPEQCRAGTHGSQSENRRFRPARLDLRGAVGRNFRSVESLFRAGP